ncbi:glycosyltransferase [Psychrobacter sp. ANT_WB68]|uniref:glycosyltransferase n=1 Tax=Psychrobacter sp. ANT_WB68 TaxID=2597355 RepID=UPI0011F1355E|nr:glycosyltransferase [Psychrobacter sp. ANT_WB68]KAA0914430.1 glycosyltransferase [Psychrobacter sp. ANT_WB68]
MTQPIIVLILKALEGRGAERMVTTLAHAYIEMGYSVYVLCLEDTQDMPLDTRVKYHIVPYYQTFSNQQIEENSIQATAYKTVAARIDEYVLKNIGKPDLILVNIYKLNWIMAYSRLPNIVNVLHTAVSKQFEAQLTAHPVQTIKHLKMVYGAHPCSCVSVGAGKDLLALIGKNTTRTTTIYNPCDDYAIKEAAGRLSDISQFGLTTCAYMIHVGSFDTMKNHHDLLHAYAQTSCTQPLVLVGQGRLENEIKQLAVQLNVQEQVKFLGFQENPYPLIASAALLVLTSKFEGFGYVIVEAQALEVPVISTDCPFGPRELLPEQNLVPVGDISTLSSLMKQAISNPDSYKIKFNQQLRPPIIANQYLAFNKGL